MRQQDRQGQPQKDSRTIVRANVALTKAISSCRKKKKKIPDTSKIIYYSYNKKAIMLLIISNQKISYNLSNLYINDC